MQQSTTPGRTIGAVLDELMRASVHLADLENAKDHDDLSAEALEAIKENIGDQLGVVLERKAQAVVMFKFLLSAQGVASTTLIEEFVDHISELAKVNRLTGIWDNRRFQEAKKPYAEVDNAFFYKTEKLSRKNVELRAVHRTALDILFEKLLDTPASNQEAC